MSVISGQSSEERIHVDHEDSNLNTPAYDNVPLISQHAIQFFKEKEAYLNHCLPHFYYILWYDQKSVVVLFFLHFSLNN